MILPFTIFIPPLSVIPTIIVTLGCPVEFPLLLPRPYNILLLRKFFYNKTSVSKELLNCGNKVISILGD